MSIAFRLRALARGALRSSSVPALLVLLAFADSAPAGGPRFVPSPNDPRVFLAVDDDAPVRRAVGAMPAAATANVWHLPGFTAPGSAVLAGADLYVSNHLGTKLVTVVDVQTPGAETIASTIATPVDPIALAVAGGELWVVGPARDALHHRALAGGTFSAVPLPPTFPLVTYGDALAVHPDGVRLFVSQPFDDRVVVVDRTTGQVAHTITDLHHLPHRLVFFAGGTRLAALSLGLDAPHCEATGPHVAIYDVSGAPQRLFEIDVHGRCPLGLVADAGRLLVVRAGDVLAFDGATGQPLGGLEANVANGAAVVAGPLFVQSTESLLQLDADLAHVEKSKDLLQAPATWLPPLEGMVASPDGRLFVCNRSDGALTVVDVLAPVDVYGKGCPGSGDQVPVLGCIGTPVVLAPFTLDVQNGLGGAPAFLFFGAEPSAQGLGGSCSLLVEPLIAPFGPLVLSGVGPGAGTAQLAAPVPAGTPLGTRASLQAFVADPGGAFGFCASNGLDLRVE